MNKFYLTDNYILFFLSVCEPSLYTKTVYLDIIFLTICGGFRFCFFCPHLFPFRDKTTVVFFVMTDACILLYSMNETTVFMI
jgi:hypothetical protein